MNILYPILLIILIVLLILSAILIATSSFLLSYNDKKLIKKGGNEFIKDLGHKVNDSLLPNYLSKCISIDAEGVRKFNVYPMINESGYIILEYNKNTGEYYNDEYSINHSAFAFRHNTDFPPLIENISTIIEKNNIIIDKQAQEDLLSIMANILKFQVLQSKENYIKYVVSQAIIQNISIDDELLDHLYINDLLYCKFMVGFIYHIVQQRNGNIKDDFLVIKQRTTPPELSNLYIQFSDGSYSDEFNIDQLLLFMTGANTINGMVDVYRPTIQTPDHFSDITDGTDENMDDGESVKYGQVANNGKGNAKNNSDSDSVISRHIPIGDNDDDDDDDDNNNDNYDKEGEEVRMREDEDEGYDEDEDNDVREDKDEDEGYDEDEGNEVGEDEDESKGDDEEEEVIDFSGVTATPTPTGSPFDYTQLAKAQALYRQSEENKRKQDEKTRKNNEYIDIIRENLKLYTKRIKDIVTIRSNLHNNEQIKKFKAMCQKYISELTKLIDIINNYSDPDINSKILTHLSITLIPADGFTISKKDKKEFLKILQNTKDSIKSINSGKTVLLPSSHFKKLTGPSTPSTLALAKKQLDTDYNTYKTSYMSDYQTDKQLNLTVIQNNAQAIRNQKDAIKLLEQQNTGMHKKPSNHKRIKVPTTTVTSFQF